MKLTGRGAEKLLIAARKLHAAEADHVDGLKRQWIEAASNRDYFRAWIRCPAISTRPAAEKLYENPIPLCTPKRSTNLEFATHVETRP